jgi:hypothetical protein
MNDFVKGTAGLAAGLWCATVSAEPNACAEVEAADNRPRAVMHEARMHEYAARGGEVESLLVQQDDGALGERLTGVTRLRDGTRLWEEARFDRTGHLLRAESMCSSPSGNTETVVLEPQSGSLELRTSAGAKRWTVPTDYPWIWVPHSCGSAQAISLATPVSVLAALRPAAHGGVRRLIDTTSSASHTIASDQVVVDDDPGAYWVVLGDDAMLVRDGLPEHWRASSLGVDVEHR